MLITACIYIGSQNYFTFSDRIKFDNALAKREKEVKEKINYIAENPKNIQIRYQDIQIAVLKTFASTIHFRFLKEENRS